MKINNYYFDTDNQTYVMGILNVTPDSFSDGNMHNSIDKALLQAEKMINEGAAIIDVGGESTRPGYTVISDEEEIERTCPVIEKIKNNFDIAVSIDTYKSKVADATLSIGADILNDIHGLKYDKDIAKVVARHNAGVCLMHNRDNLEYGDGTIDAFVKQIVSDLQESIDIAKNNGIDMSKVMVDPGVGFAKNLEHNLMITNNLERLKILGYPILLATSRKSMIGLTLDLPVDQREEGTIATTVLGVLKGASFVRVHDVEKNVRAIKMTRAIIESGKVGNGLY